jgi:hypothetical protein
MEAAMNRNKGMLVCLCLLTALAVFFIGFDIFNNYITATYETSTERVNTVYHPEESDRVLVNPYMGFVPTAATSRSAFKPFTMVYAGISWRELEPEKGIYKFEEFEKKIKFDYWKEKNIKFVIRFFIDYPSKEGGMDIPDWLYEEIGEKGTWYEEGEKKGFSPDYSNNVLIDNHEKIIRAIAERYDKEGTVAFIQLGSLGHYGEWHTTYIPREKKAFPEVSVSDMYVSHYTKHFKNKKLLMRRPFEIARSNNMGLFNDSFGDKKQTEDYFLKWINEGYKDHYFDYYHPPMKDFWKSAPSSGEFSNYPGEAWIEEENFQRTLNMLKQSHTSFLGPSAPIYEELSVEKQKRLDILLKTMGYRFKVIESTYYDEIKSGENQEGTIKIANEGIAPFYFEWPMYVTVKNSKNNEVASMKLDYDIRTLLPGEAKISYSIDLDNDLEEGEYKIYVFITDSDSGKPAIAFANKIIYEDKMCYLGSFKIKKPVQNK